MANHHPPDVSDSDVSELNPSLRGRQALLACFDSESRATYTLSTQFEIGIYCIVSISPFTHNTLPSVRLAAQYQVRSRLPGQRSVMMDKFRSITSSKPVCPGNSDTDELEDIQSF